MSLVGFFTKAGLDLALDVQGGLTSLTLTRVTAGSGETAANAAALADEKQTLTAGAPRVRGGTLSVPVTLSEANAAADYTLRELGVYAKSSDGDEVLYQVYRLDSPLAVTAGGENVCRFFLRQSVGAEGLTVACAGAGLALADDLAALEEAVAGKADASAAERTVYVSRAGSDATGDGSAENPYRTLQHAADTLPKLGAGGVKLVLRAGTYAEDARLEGFCCAGGLTVAGYAGESVSLRSLALVRCTGGAAVENLKLTGYPSSAEGWSLRVADCDRVRVEEVSCTFASSAPAHGAFFFTDTPHVRVAGAVISNHPVAVEVLRAAAHLSPSFSGTGNTVALRAGAADEGGAAVFWDGCTLAGESRALGGAQVYGSRAET